MASGKRRGARPGRSRRRAISLAVGTALALLVAFTAFVLQLTQDAVRKEAEGRVRSTAELSAQLVREQSLRFEEVVASYAERLAGIAAPRRGRLSARDTRLTDRALHGLISDVDGIASGTLTDAAGRVLVSVPAGRLTPGLDLSGRDWFRGAASQPKPYLSRAFISAAPDKPKLTVVAVRVTNRTGVVLGVLAAGERRRTQGFADAFGRKARGVVTVTDQAGVIVGRTAGPTRRLVSSRDDPVVAAALAGRSGVRVRDLHGRRTVSGYAPVPGTGWTVTADVPASTAFAGVDRVRTALLIGAVVAALVLAGVVPLLATRLGRAREALGVSEAFQRDLMPSVLPDGVRSYYAPSERRILLGGDFLDAVTTPDGGLAMCIGDVSGHGPRAAALAATLRAGWRTLASAGSAVENVELLDRLVEGERPEEEIFATFACAWISPAGDRVRYAIAGHPPPLLVLADGVQPLAGRGPALGIGLGSGDAWPVIEKDLSPGWAMVLYTDGLTESRDGPTTPRLGGDGLQQILQDCSRDGRLDADVLLARLRALTDGHPDGLDDDLAVVITEDRLGR